jgi:hypothetical protein
MYGTLEFITVFAKARHLTLYGSRQPPHTLHHLIHILTLCFRLRLVLRKFSLILILSGVKL